MYQRKEKIIKKKYLAQILVIKNPSDYHGLHFSSQQKSFKQEFIGRDKMMHVFILIKYFFIKSIKFTVFINIFLSYITINTTKKTKIKK